jgi:hypothetical protein
MNKAFSKWIDSKKKERYFLYQIVEMSGLKWGTFRRFRKGKKIRRSTALIIHKNTGIAMEDLGFGDELPDPLDKIEFNEILTG